MKKTTRLMIIETVEEDDFPRTTIDTTAEDFESWTRVRCPTPMLPPAYRALDAWNRRPVR